MDTSSRPGSEEDVTAEISERAAIVAGLKKHGCDELSPKEWAEIIGVALAIGKPRFEYLPTFLPPSGKKLKCFHLSRRISHQDKEFCEGGWLDRELHYYSNCATDGSVLAYVTNTNRVIQICEMSRGTDKLASTKVLLNTKGVFILARCSRPKVDGSSLGGAPVLNSVDILSDQDQLIKTICHYPQIGPLTLFAISTMVNDAHRMKLKAAQTLGWAGERLNAICANVDMTGGRFVQRFPWGLVMEAIG
jgi:hypothetical protein